MLSKSLNKATTQPLSIKRATANMENQTPNQLLPAFYKQYNLPPDGGQSDSRVKVELTPKIHVFIPNFDARRKAVLRHDVHHLVTGFTTSLEGEGAISAWEISSGCANYWAALVINSQGMLMGLALHPVSTFRAFVKGRYTSNLYKEKFKARDFLDMKVGNLRKELKLADYDDNQKAAFPDLISFIVWTLFCLLIALITLVFMPILVFYNIKEFLFRSPKNKQVSG